MNGQHSVTRLSALLALLLAVALRLYDISGQGLFNEEGYSIVTARESALNLIELVTRLDSNTPLHYLLLKFWGIAAGESEFAARALSVVFGVLTAAVAARLARRELAAWLVAVAPVCIGLSQEARMYALLMLLFTLSIALLKGALRDRQIGGARWWAWSACAIALFATHVLGGIAVAAQMLWLVFTFLRRRRNPTVFPNATPLAAAGVTLAVIAIWTLALLSANDPGGTTYSGRLPYAQFVLPGFGALLLPPVDDAPVQRAAGFAAIALILITLVAARRLRGPLAVALLCVLGAIAVSAWTGKYGWRYTTQPAAVLLAGLSKLIRLRKRAAIAQPARTAAAAICVLTLAAGWQFWRRDPAFAHEDFRGAALFVKAHAQPGEPILLVPNFSHVFGYYFGKSGWHTLPDAPMLNVADQLAYDNAVPITNRVLDGAASAWLVLFDEALLDPGAITRALLRRQAKAFAPAQDIGDFHGMRVQRYEFFQPYRPLPAQMSALKLSSIQDGSGAARGLSSQGCAQLNTARADAKYLEVVCFWQITRDTSLPFDTKVSLRLLAANGAQVVQNDINLHPTGLPGVAFDKTLMSVYTLEMPPATKPGTYTLRAIPYTPDGEVSPKVTTKITLE